MIFEERSVPMEVRHMGIHRSFKPNNLRNYRLVLDNKGNWYVYPKVFLYDDEKAAILGVIRQVEQEPNTTDVQP